MTSFEFFVLFIIIYWLFGPRVLAMVDVLSTRLQAIYNPWGGLPQTDNHLAPYMRRQVAQRRREKELAKGNVVQNKDETDLKTRPWRFPECPKPQIKTHLCQCCEANQQEPIHTAILKDQDVVNILDIEETKSNNFFVRCFCYLVHNFRVQNYPFVTISDSVYKDDSVQDAISDSAKELLSEYPEAEVTDSTFNKIMASQKRKAKKIIQDMHSAMSNLMLKITSYLMYKLLPRFVTSVCVHPSQIEMVKKASASNLPLIFVPLHRSHLDYILIIFTLLNSGIRPPLTAAGINLKIPVFGILLRWLGAFYIKRRIEPSSGAKDVIYRTALHTYMVQCLKAGHNIKFYIEGGRTRTGKPCIPKVGLLSVIVDAYMDGTVPDALLVPVSVNYDKLVDGNFIRELLGQPKEKETFSAAMSAIWQTLNSSYGACRIDFNQPYSLKELVNAFQSIAKPPSPTSELPPIPIPSLPLERGISSPPLISVSSLSSLHGTDLVNTDHRLLVEHIANHLVHDCVAACPVMSTNILAFILLNKYRTGVKMGVLVDVYDALRNDLISSCRDVAFSGDSIDVVNTAIHILGPGLIKRDRPAEGCEWDEVITPVTMLPNVIELSYYGNALMPHYALRGILATSVLALVKPQTQDSIRNVLLKESDLMQHSLYLCEVLQFEFIFNKPCIDLKSVLSDTLKDISQRGILPSNTGTGRGRNYLDEDSDDDEFAVIPEPLYRLSSKPEHLDDLRLYGMALRPLMDTYIAAVMGLHRLVGRQMTETEYAKEVIEELKSQLETGYALYGESCSVDPIKNACKVLKKLRVLDSFTRDSVKLIYLKDEYNNSAAVLDLIEDITKYKWSDAL